MNKSELIDAVASSTGMTKVNAEKAAEVVITLAGSAPLTLGSQLRSLQCIKTRLGESDYKTTGKSLLSNCKLIKEPLALESSA